MRPGARLATRLVFLVAGMSMAVWTVLVPFIALRLRIDDARLGLLLLCLGGGSLVAMPVAGVLTGRFGCRAVISLAGVPLCASLPLLALAPGTGATAVSVVLLGASLGAVDVAMNVQAVLVERDAGTPLMSGFHALYSAGGLLGAVCTGALLLEGIAQPGAVAAVAGLMFAMLLAAIPSLLPLGDSAPGRKMVVLPSGPLIVLGLLCAGCFLAEGAIADWSGLFLIRVDGTPRARAGLGFAGFSACMMLGRFGGDRLVRRFGGVRVLVAGGLVASVGLAVAVLGGRWPVAVSGFALAGAGTANLVPLLFSAAGRQSAQGGRMPAGLAIAAVGTLGYAGILLGPALLGFVSHAADLSMALLLVALLLLLVPLGGRLVAAGR